MANVQTTARAVQPPPPSKHQLALMIWVAVFPTLTVLNLLLGDLLANAPSQRPAHLRSRHRGRPDRDLRPHAAPAPPPGPAPRPRPPRRGRGIHPKWVMKS